MYEWEKFKRDLEHLLQAVAGAELGDRERWLFWRHAILWWLAEVMKDLPLEWPGETEEGQG